MIHNPKQLLLLDNYENSLYDIELELKTNHPNNDIQAIVANIREKDRLDAIFEKYSPEIVFHAAAHKHVPLMENNPTEAIKNNVFGTYNLVNCSDEFNVKRFILISTDKAVNPTNIMGATKRLCEMIIQAKDKRSETEYVAVRFGNVLGSNGSVVPLFKKQMAHGGPLTVTHKEVTRYFMTWSASVSSLIKVTPLFSINERNASDVRIRNSCPLLNISSPSSARGSTSPLVPTATAVMIIQPITSYPNSFYIIVPL